VRTLNEEVSPMRRFDSYTEARQQFRTVLDSAAAGRVTTVRREHETFSVVSAALLRGQLERLVPADAVVAAEGGGWAAWVPALPVHGEAATFDAAVDDLITALREYADDWNDRLLNAPNHQANWAVVELIELSTDDELRRWIIGSDAQASAAAVSSAR
jgi:hypothetical protein